MMVLKTRPGGCQIRSPSSSACTRRSSTPVFAEKYSRSIPAAVEMERSATEPTAATRTVETTPVNQVEHLR